MEQPREASVPENPFAGIPVPDIEATGPADDERLIRHTFATDARAGCELLFRRYYQPLCSHAVRFVYSRAIAEDIVAEVFCQFYENGTFAKIEVSYRAYLYKTVRSRAYNYLRWETGRTTDLSLADATPISSTQTPDSITEYEELCHDLETAINGLPPQCRRIYLLSRFEEKKYQEIADELHLAPKTVEVQIRRAKLALRSVLLARWSLALWGLWAHLIPSLP